MRILKKIFRNINRNMRHAFVSFTILKACQGVKNELNYIISRKLKYEVLLNVKERLYERSREYVKAGNRRG